MRGESELSPSSLATDAGGGVGARILSTDGEGRGGEVTAESDGDEGEQA
jgi:hypothetical protein